MKVVVSGTGYVGLVTAVTLSNIGHDVTCVDVIKEKIDALNNGICPIYEEGLPELMEKNKERLTYTLDTKNSYKDADVIVIAVGTPEREDGSANLDYVFDVAKEIGFSLEKDAVVVVKSTVPIGTNDEVERIIKENVKSGINVSVASNPEFLAQGTAVRDALYAKRIVVGVESGLASKIMKELYLPLTKEPYNVPYLEMNRRSAEMVKYASNDFLALKISYVNEIANLCEKLGANVEDVTKGMGYDDRIGNKFLNAGIGYGGSCFPKDTKALHYLSKEMGAELTTVKACIEVNKNQKTIMFKRLMNDMKDIKNKTIAVIGLAFKPNTDDVREAPSIDNIILLLNEGANVKAFDPVGTENFKKALSKRGINSENITYFDNIDDTIKDADVVLIMTEWDVVKKYDINKYKSLMKTPIIYDGRNCYNLDAIKNKDIIYISIGRQA